MKLLEDFMDTYKLASAPTDKTCVITVHCPCGEVWTYKRPRHYGGKAFSTKACPACGNTGEKKTLSPDCGINTPIG